MPDEWMRKAAEEWLIPAEMRCGSANEFIDKLAAVIERHYRAATPAPDLDDIARDIVCYVFGFEREELAKRPEWEQDEVAYVRQKLESVRAAADRDMRELVKEIVAVGKPYLEDCDEIGMKDAGWKAKMPKLSQWLSICARAKRLFERNKARIKARNLAYFQRTYDPKVTQPAPAPQKETPKTS